MTAALLVRRILLSASKGGLEVAGAALLGPAWPVMRGALAPVLDLLTEKLGGEDLFGSREAAERAAAAFEEDERLGELLRTNLGEALLPLLEGQERLDAGFEQLRQVVLEGSEKLDEITRSVGALDARLEAGVTLSDDTIDRLAEAMEKRLAVTLSVRTFAESEPAVAAAVSPDQWQTRGELVDEADRAQANAVQLVSAGRAAEALETLHPARAAVAAALVVTPSDLQLRLRYGYLLKATAQAEASAGDDLAAARSLDRAEALFRVLMDDLPADAGARADIAGALNGLGNVLAQRGRHDEAVELYHRALRLAPTYAYAWHDLFGSLVALADQGDLRAEALDEAWQRLRATAGPYPQLEPAYLAQLEADHYRRLRPAAS